MKRIGLIIGLLGAAILLVATPGPDHKVSWCHFPPGNPANVQILDIDVAADGDVGPAHQNHTGDGPVCYNNSLPGFDCPPNPPGVHLRGSNAILAPLGPNCGRAQTCNLNPFTDPNLGPLTLNSDCSCPLGTPREGLQPVADPSNGNALTCATPGQG